MRWIALSFVVAALAIVFGVGAYFLYVLDRWPLTVLSPQELVTLGTYFGGVAGPLLALLTVLGLGANLLMQSEQLEMVADAAIKDQHVRMLLEIGRDLDALEQQHIKDQVTLGMVLSGAADLQPHHVDSFNVLLDRYFKILGHYASGVELFRDNVSPYFDCRAFEQRGLRLLDRVDPFKHHLGFTGEVGASIMRGHFEGTIRIEGR